MFMAGWLNVAPTRAQSAACASAPVVPTGSSYATSWKVGSILYFDNVPIGPAGWRVNSRLKDGTTETCFSETWTLKSVVFSSTRNSAAGRIDDLDTTTRPYVRRNVTETTGSSCDGGGRCINNYYRYNTSWDNVGMYGILSDSKDTLNLSNTRYPYEWVVTGTFE